MYKLTFPIILSIIGPIFEQARDYKTCIYFLWSKMIMDDKVIQLMNEGKPWNPKSGIDYWKIFPDKNV